MPLRLSGGATDGLTAEQHARLAADLVACVRTVPFAWVTYTASATPTIHAYNGMNGVGVAHNPAPTFNGTGDVTITWSPSFDDPYDTGEPVNINFAKASCHGATAIRARIVSVARNAVRIATTNMSGGAAANCKVTVCVF